MHVATAKLLHAMRSVPADVPLAFDIAEVQFILPVSRLPRSEDGTLPLSSQALELSFTLARGARARVLVEGSPTMGLPHGIDRDVWLALLAVYKEEVLGGNQDILTTGRLEGLSLRRLLRHMGTKPNGPSVRRAREGILRLGAVKFVFEGTTPHQPAANAVETPRRTARVRETRRTVQIPLLSSSITTAVTDHGEFDLIEWVEIDTRWMAQMASGWAVWVNHGAYRELDGVYAKSVYARLAVEAASGTPPPWHFTLQDLRNAWVVDPGERPARTSTRLDEAFSEMRAAGVVEEVEQSGSRNKMAWDVHPGPVLRGTAHMRGAVLGDTVETHALLLAAARLGFTDRDARTWAEERPDELRWALLYAVYQAEVRENVGSPAAYARQLLRNGFNPASDPAFQSWYDRLPASEAKRLEPPTNKALAQPPAQGDLLVPLDTSGVRPQIEDGDASARVLWDDAVAEVRRESNTENHPLLNEYLANVVPLRVEGEVLIIAYRTDLYVRGLRKALFPAVEAVIASMTDGAVREVDFRLASS